jgi:hypothetical protein
MEKEKLSSLREAIVGRWPLVVGDDTREEVPDVPLSMYLPFILLINIIDVIQKTVLIDCIDSNDFFEIDTINYLVKVVIILFQYCCIPLLFTASTIFLYQMVLFPES